MFRELRRTKQSLPLEEVEAILKRNTSGTLAVLGDEGYPYAVPVSYVYEDYKIYFHCAMTGHKIDAIHHCDKVSFCVIDQDDIVPEKFTTFYKSIIAFGRAKVLEGEEKYHAIDILCEKYSPNIIGRKEEIESSFEHLIMIEIKIEHMTGKAAIELMNQ